MRAFLISLAIAAVAIGATSVSANTLDNATPAQVVTASFDALNRGDAAAAAAAFAPNGKLITPLGGCTPCTGRTVIEQHLAAAIANGTTITLVGQPRVRGAIVVVRGEVRSRNFPAGIERVIGVFRSVVRKGLIVRQTNVYDRKDPQTAALLALIKQATTSTT